MNRKVYPSLTYISDNKKYKKNSNKNHQLIPYNTSYEKSVDKRCCNSCDYIEIKVITACILILLKNFVIKSSENINNNRENMMSVVGLDNIIRVIENIFSSTSIKSLVIPTLHKLYNDILVILFGTDDDQKEIFLKMTREVNKLTDECKRNNLIRFIGSIEMLINMFDSIYHNQC